MHKLIKSFLLVAILLCVNWPVWAEKYTVMPGDTLGNIAKVKGIPIDEIIRINGIVDKNKIRMGQKIEIPEKGSRKVDRRQIVSSRAVGIDYAHTYKHQMGNPFARRVNGVQKRLSEKEYNRHLSNIIKHGVSREGARAILAAKENGISAGELFLPNGTIVESVSFGKDEVWTGGVLINVKEGGIKAIRYLGWTGESILDAWNCGNYVNPREVHMPPNIPSVPEIQEEVSEVPTEPIKEQEELLGPRRCKNCPDEFELDTGLFRSFGFSGNGSIRGVGAYGEFMYWKNFADDCSSEYFWGLGMRGNVYQYYLMNMPSEGDGGMLAVQGGLKRVYRDEETGLGRHSIFKPFVGAKWSDWRNPDRDWSINQIGPFIGEYTEHRRELIYDTLWGFATIESCFGIGNQRVRSSFSDTKPESRFAAEALVGLDYKISRVDVLRAYAGVSLEDVLTLGVLGVEWRHDLKKNWGTVVLGLQARLYSIENVVGLVCVKWEINQPVNKWYADKCQASVKLVGYGVGGNQVRDAQLASVLVQQELPAPSTADRVFASLAGSDR